MAIRTIKGIKLTTLQREIADCCDLLSIYDYIVVSCARQVGKSTVASQIICSWVFNNDNYKVCFYAPSYKQGREQYRRMEKGLEKIPGIVFNKTELTIKLPNGSFIQFQTAENDNMRGSTYDSIIVDEASFVRDDIYSAAILPTVAVSLSKKAGKVLLISTPKSKNYFYDLFTMELPNKISIRATSEEGGLISAEILAQIKKTTPEHIYRNEYLAEFVEAGQGVFAYVNCISDEPFTSIEGCIAGIDFGMENDYTVLTILNNKAELVWIERWRATDWDDVLNKIANRLKEYKVVNAYAETNGIGNMPVKMLKKKYPNVNDWVTSNKSKVNIINKLSADFQQGLIKVPRLDYLLNELDAYSLEYTPATGKVTYGARSGFNDDCVMSLAIANWHRLSTSKRFLGSTNYR